MQAQAQAQQLPQQLTQQTQEVPSSGAEHQSEPQQSDADDNGIIEIP
jgi:hypothetical protein